MKLEYDEIDQLLRDHYRYESQIKWLDEHIELLEARATKKTASYSKDAGSTPITNPKPSKVEKNAIKLAEYREKRDQVNQLYSLSGRLYKSMRPHQRYLIKCVKANKMPYKDFAKREKIQPVHVKENVDRIMQRLLDTEW